MEPDTPEGPSGSRLNGWKEIAAHLGKGVRTVQRWEREYGLPIRRIGREGGEIVFAFREELDRWSAEAGRRRATEDDLEAPPETTEVPVQLVAPPRRRWALIAAVCIIAFVLLGLALAPWRSATTPRIARAAVEGRTLVAFGADGERLWTHALDFEPSHETYTRVFGPQYGINKIVLADLDNDGSDELLFMTSSIGLRGPQGYRVFNADGSVRFSVEPEETVKFGNELYAGPWAAYRMFVTDNPDGTRSIWTAFIHSLRFPTLLLESDAAGRVKSKYWSNGYIEVVALARIGGRQRVLIGGTHNDTEGASLAVFDYGSVRGSAPAVAERFRCRSCEAGGPSEFLVFPRQCVARAVDGQATVAELRFDAAGNSYVLTGEGSRNPDGDYPAGIWYTIDPGMTTASMTFIEGTRIAHNRLERERLLDHAFSDATDAIDRAAFLKWNGTGFTTDFHPKTQDK